MQKHALADDACAEGPGCSLDDAAVEDQLDVVGASQIKVLADDFLKEDAAMHGTIDNLGEGELDLAHRAARLPAARRHPSRAASTRGKGRVGFNQVSQILRAVQVPVRG